MNQKKCGSQGETTIRRYLNKHNVHYVYDAPVCQVFKDAEGEIRRKRFDFVLLDEDLEPIGAIEYDGEQHYMPQGFMRKQEDYMLACHADDLKTAFCEALQLPLLRIRYDQNEIEDIVEVFLQNKKKYSKKKHNPEYRNMQEYFADRVVVA